MNFTILFSSKLLSENTVAYSSELVAHFILK